MPRRPRRPIMASAAGEGRQMRIGFIGTGTMGTPIAGCLVAAGHRVTVYDIRPEATAALATLCTQVFVQSHLDRRGHEYYL